MDVGGTRERMADYLRGQRDKVVTRWTELVVAGVRGRISPDEVRRELSDLFSLVIRVLSDADDHAAGELRASLDELSRARDGFTPSETALSVFSLKDAVYEQVADTADLVPECTISGIRPQVAQTIVSLGIELGDIATKATLADALALRQAGLKVVQA